ncbi:hypothetical protein ACOSQ2_010521 [Xanthoceras sorbifolium]
MLTSAFSIIRHKATNHIRESILKTLASVFSNIRQKATNRIYRFGPQRPNIVGPSWDNVKIYFLDVRRRKPLNPLPRAIFCVWLPYENIEPIIQHLQCAA